MTFTSARLPVSAGQVAHDAQRCRQPRYGLETFIAGTLSGLSNHSLALAGHMLQGPGQVWHLVFGDLGGVGILSHAQPV